MARALRTTLRIAHLLAFGALFGGHLFGVGPERLLPALVGTVGTGLVFSLFEVAQAPIWIAQVRGLAAFGKLGLVGLFIFSNDETVRTAILCLAAVIGVVAAHMPGRYRYYSLWHRRVVKTSGKG